jgi:adenosylcobinamide-GDP ribazoletransferase
MSVLRRRVEEARLAFMLLSRIPMGRMEEAPPLADAAWAYPLVGMVVGGVAGLVFWLAVRAGLPPAVAALLALGAGILLTGAMHEDGLADLADGFGGGRTKVRKLEIMRDSRIGTYGVLALVLVVGLRVALIAALPASGMAARLAGLGAASRALLPVLMLCLPPARADGLGQAAGAQMAPARVLAGLGLGLLLTLLFWPRHGVLAALCAMALTAALVGLLARRQIGGFTGDVLGATQLLAETAGLLVLSAHIVG